jgi:hypothetical protein
MSSVDPLDAASEAASRAMFELGEVPEYRKRGLRFPASFGGIPFAQEGDGLHHDVSLVSLVYRRGIMQYRSGRKPAWMPPHEALRLIRAYREIEAWVAARLEGLRRAEENERRTPGSAANKLAAEEAAARLSSGITDGRDK